MSELPACVEVTTGDNPAAAVVWLHGLGASGHDFEPIVPHLQLPGAVRYVFPHAPEIPVTINGGMVMPAWYDIDPDGGFDSGREGIEASAAIAAALIAREVERGIPEERIVLAGFSQGGVIALQQGLRHPRRLAGILALSTYLHGADRLPAELDIANAETPIFMAHGAMDPMIPIARAVGSRDSLTNLGYDVSWKQYGMGHEVCFEEISDIASFLASVLFPG